MISTALLSLLLQSPAPLQPVWDTPMRNIRSVVLSQHGDCAAVVTLDRISLLNRSGKETWHWDFKSGNRFMTASRVAVSPRCDWIGVAGSESYRYTWIAHTNGRLIPLRTKDTPVSVAISHRGDMLAIGTGGGDVHLFNSDGIQRWQRTLTYCCVRALSFSADDQAIVSSDWGVGVLSIDGNTKSLEHVAIGLQASKDLKTFVGWYEPNHGTGVCSISLVDSTGKTLWQKNAPYSPQAIVSPAGDLVVATAKDNQDQTEAAARCDSDSPSPLRLLSSSGEILRTFSSSTQPAPLMFSPDGKWFLIRVDNIEAWALSGRVLWTIPAFSKFSGTISVSEDLLSIVEWSENRIAWFTPPVQ